MRYVFRTDASPEIGSGHVMRSSAIAEEMIARGLRTVFVGRISNMPWVSERIQSLGFESTVHDSKDFMSLPESDVLILDSYQISKSENFIQPSKWRAITCIQDPESPDYLCNLRVHPGLASFWSEESIMQTLSGPKYIPLRKSIKHINRQMGAELNIIVVGGGADLYGFVPILANLLIKIHENFRVSLISNSKEFKDLDNRFSVFPNGPILDELANKADLVFTTASTTCLEFLARGCAVAVGCSVKNQESNYFELGNLGVVAQIGMRVNQVWQLNDELIENLVKSKSLRDAIRNKSSSLIDLYGASRIVDKIVNIS
jgi:spore coat polysaccharide biosynthesis predicted glycosyltransferase SpsG